MGFMNYPKLGNCKKSELRDMRCEEEFKPKSISTAKRKATFSILSKLLKITF